MALWWLKLMALFGREPQVRESKSVLRGSAKGAGKGPGKGAAKGGGKGATAESVSAPHTAVWLFGAGLVVLLLHLVMFPPVPQFTADFPQSGEIAGAEIRAPFSFDASLLERDVQMKRLERVLVEPPVLRSLADDDQAVRMEMWLGQLAAGLAADSLGVEDLTNWLSLQFPAVGTAALRQLVTSEEPDSLVTRMTSAWRRIEAGGVADMLPSGRYDRVVVIGPQAEVLRDRDEVVSQANLEERLTAELRAAGLGAHEAVEAAAVMRHFVRPNLVYDPEHTAGRQETARQAVPTRREFISGERIVDQGVRVTEQQARHLEELAALLQARGEGDDRGGRTVRYLTRSLLLILALAVYGWLGRIHFPRELRKRRVVVALTVVVCLFVAGASLALEKPELGPLAVPMVLLSLLTTVLFKDKIGYTTTLLALTLLAVLPGLGAAPVFVWFVLGMVTVISVRRIHKRSQFYQTILLLTALSVVLIFLLGDEALGQQAGNIYLVGLFASVLSVALGLFLLPVVEPLVGVCSDLTLLELSDLNHPLLQRMALEAQGTYHHSQVVGQLAEHAARAIDANALLTRVGALFHDIGKMQKSEYYVENQRPEYNKHNELSPSMSALVIAAHVKDGIELGRKWRLPQMIIDFIPEHHGTMVMEYFYHKALEADGNETVKVDDFRYPGPKPQSRETAILMLADAMEAATRSLAKPTPSRIKEMTKQILDKRMLSGELDESKLSLSDIARIRDSFIPLLVGIHHARIVYPSQPDRGQSERSTGERAAADRSQEKTGERQGERKTRP